MKYLIHESFFFVIVSFLLVTPIVAIDNPRILILNSWLNPMPSGAVTNYAQARTFTKFGLFTVGIGWNHSHNQKLFIKAGIPFNTFQNHKFPGFKESDESSDLNLYTSVLNTCKYYDINIVITNRIEDIPVLKKIRKSYPIKIIFHRVGDLNEGSLSKKIALTDDIEAVVGNLEIINFVDKSKKELSLSIKHTKVIIPFWDDNKCLNFSTHLSREEYFKKTYNIDCKNFSVICSIANFVNPCKNHHLLLKALKDLIFKKNKQVLLMFAGGGSLKPLIEQHVRNLNLQNHVFFLGSIDTEDIVALLYHCNMHVLPSYYENFSLANLEACCMKKPVICARETNTARLIKDFETGILFKSNDVQDLTDKIEYLLDHPEIQNNIGNNAHAYVMKHYSSDHLCALWLELFKNL